MQSIQITIDATDTHFLKTYRYSAKHLISEYRWKCLIQNELFRSQLDKFVDIF